MKPINGPVSALARATLESASLPPLRLECSLAEAWPWPGLLVRAAARIGERLVRLRQLQADGEAFLYAGARLTADPVDALIVRTLRGLPCEDGVAFRVDPERFAPVLALLRQASGALIRRETPRIAGLRVLGAPAERVLALERLENRSGLVLRAEPEFRCAEQGGSLGRPLARTGEWLVFERAVAPACEALGDPLLDKLFEGAPREVEGEAAWKLLHAAQAATPRLEVHLPAELARASAAARPPRPALHVEADPGDPRRVKATLRFEAAGPGGARGGSFGAEEILRAAARGVPVLERGGALCRVDAETVEQARAALRKLAAADGAAEGKGEGFSAAGEQVPELLEYARARQGDPASPWNVYVSEAVEGAHKVADEPAELRLRLGVEEDASETWFTVDASLDVGGRALTPEEIRELMRKRRQWMYYGRQWRRVDAQSYAAFRLQAERAGLRKTGSGRFRFKPEERAKVESLFSLAGTVEHAERYREFLENLRGFGGMEPQAPPDSLRVTLRPYQREGYSWLRFLQRYGLNGILADEMGLGKTAQTLAALAALRDEQGPWPSLVICPTSLVDNWRAEARKVDPRLKVLRYTGSPGRRDTLRKRIPEMDLVLATYATARNDALLLREESWRYVILDEAHFIKNAAAATTKAVKTIPSRHRLALTGTPVQNRLDELWSLFDFLMPGYLGRFAGFFRRYEEPIVKGQAPDAAATERRDGERAAEALRERIGPFVLRRLKTEVARDLPPKIEQDLFCSLTADQIALYRKFATSDEARAAVKEVEEKGAARAQTQILAALTMLRKICNHPDLVYTAAESEKRKRMTPLAGYAERSGKLLALADLFDQCRAGNHRLLLFCQQTRMLDILEYYLQERGDACLRLDGGTPGHARQGLVDRFNADPSLFVFLISTRAGGSGLNLTGADTVVFYDHDWNPANDRQAQDRAWRIGQTKPVNVYRLVTQGTLEEKILARQALKLQLADAIVREDVSSLRDLTSADLVNLFRFTEAEAS